MRILITNLYLNDFCGSECWCYSIASELIRRGYEVFAYTPNRGKFFEEFEKLGVKFANSGTFDLILDNHKIVKTQKFVGPIIHTCHGIIDAESPLSGAINVAVSEASRDKWKTDFLITNGIDCERFKPIVKPSLEINKILSLCKSNTADDVIGSICESAGIEFERTFCKTVFRIEDKINSADLVIGVGRSLLDAMACGRPVVSFDDRPYYETRMLGYGYITPEKFDKYQKDSFTGNAEQCTLDKLQLAQEIFKYNPDDGIVNRKHILENYNIKDRVDQYLSIYNQMVK